MHISFKAEDVSYTEAIGGEIVQVSFDEEESCGSTEISKPYLLISVNYEFPPNEPHVEWFDGKDFGGGAKIVRYNLNQKSFKAWLDNNVSFDIAFYAEESVFKEIEKLLVDLYGKG